MQTELKRLLTLRVEETTKAKATTTIKERKEKIQKMNVVSVKMTIMNGTTVQRGIKIVLAVARVANPTIVNAMNVIATERDLGPDHVPAPQVHLAPETTVNVIISAVVPLGVIV